MLTAEEKLKIINEFKLSDDDTGSFEVQIAMLSKRILALTEHLQNHQKDFSSKRGLYKLIGERRRLLNSLRRVDEDRYALLIKRLGIRK
ncbi:MAG: 30S ribosomal protein S15 [Candidatus Cryosericum sp.]|nr:30S ribosomal protein S15 [bacterium]